jgi:small ligand-binding sensory domain FIST
MAGIANSSEEIAHGQYRLAALVGANENDRTITLAKKVEPGQLVFWALRETDAAQQDMSDTIAKMSLQLTAPPKFGMLFSCLGRGPYFYSGVDRDIELLQQKFPGMPLIGLYGNGEIAPINGVNELLQYSAVLGLFHGAV